MVIGLGLGKDWLVHTSDREDSTAGSLLAN